MSWYKVAPVPPSNEVLLKRVGSVVTPLLSNTCKSGLLEARCRRVTPARWAPYSTLLLGGQAPPFLYACDWQT